MNDLLTGDYRQTQPMVLKGIGAGYVNACL